MKLTIDITPPHLIDVSSLIHYEIKSISVPLSLSNGVDLELDVGLIKS
jgi:hypothetical protein